MIKLRDLGLLGMWLSLITSIALTDCLLWLDTVGLYVSLYILLLQYNYQFLSLLGSIRYSVHIEKLQIMNIIFETFNYSPLEHVTQ